MFNKPKVIFFLNKMIRKLYITNEKLSISIKIYFIINIVVEKKGKKKQQQQQQLGIKVTNIIL